MEYRRRNPMVYELDVVCRTEVAPRSGERPLYKTTQPGLGQDVP